MSKTVKVIIALALVLVLGIGIYFLVTAGIRDSMKLTTHEFEEYIMDERSDDPNGRAGLIDDEKHIVKVRVDGYVISG